MFNGKYTWGRRKEPYTFNFHIKPRGRRKLRLDNAIRRVSEIDIGLLPESL